MGMNGVTVPTGNGTLTPSDVHRPDLDRRSNWNEEDTEAEQYVRNKPTIPQPVPQEQADWNEDDTADPSYINNKPSIPVVPNAPAAGEEDATYMLKVSTGGSITWEPTE